MKTTKEHVTLQEIVKKANKLNMKVNQLSDKFGLIEIKKGKKSTRFLYLNNCLNDYVSVRIARHKYMSSYVLRTNGINVPKCIICKNEGAARKALKKLGGPVVVKPVHGSMGNGVTVGVNLIKDLKLAVKRALAEEKIFLVEKMHPGLDHRFLVLDGKVLGVIYRSQPVVTGDGKSTVENLIDQLNQTKKRRLKRFADHRLLKVDGHVDEVLKEQGLTRMSIPKKGQQVALRLNANLSTGGTAHAITKYHPKLGKLAIKAAKAVGLRLAGVDILTPDINEAKDATVIEINETPMLQMHFAPDVGKPVDVITPILKALFK